MGNEEIIPPMPYTPTIQISMKITLDKEIYFQEETITGNLWLEFLYPIILSDIKLSLISTEQWTYRKSEEDVYSEQNEIYLYNNLLNIRNIFNIPTPEIQLAPGKYNFPFAFTLSKDVLPSFEHPLKNKRAFIRYTIKAETLSNYVKSTTQANVIIQSKALILNSNLKFDSCVNVRSWSLFNKGTVIFTVSYPTNNYKMGDEIPLSIIINNTRGNMNTHSIAVAIIRKLQLKKKSGIKEFNFTYTITEKKFPIVVPARDKKEISLQMQITDNNNKSKDFGYEGYVNPYPNVNDYTIFMPSIHCATLKCEYEMKVTLYFEKFVTSAYLPNVVMPIAITHYTNCEYMLPKQEDIALQGETVMNQVNEGEYVNNTQGMEFSEDKSAPDAMFDYQMGNNTLHQSATMMEYPTVSSSGEQYDCRLARSVTMDVNGHNNVQMMNNFQQNYNMNNNYGGLGNNNIYYNNGNNFVDNAMINGNVYTQFQN